VAIRWLRQGYASTLASDFGPLALEAIQHKMVNAGLCRNTVNELVAWIRRIFRWAVAKQLVSPTVFQALNALPGLRKGRTTAREPEPVKPVADTVVNATLPRLPEVVADMVRFQRLTGCRPAEVCILRPCDVDMSTWRRRDRLSSEAGRGDFPKTRQRSTLSLLLSRSRARRIWFRHHGVI
jgi:integrase